MGPEATFSAQLVNADTDPLPAHSGKIKVETGKSVFYLVVNMGCPAATGAEESACGKVPQS
ncbi:hypothetical protein CRD60_07010 [Bifidobacterium aemilianum]|uniref:Uncharacterized protein n=1 Tax=Bifidobacterium aemilianum TaxID=2493120 RepID=A0A366K6R3_9BIFI|nr:hypothetical protein CRD60_07010 [Bifidobacterium aemilianum]